MKSKHMKNKYIRIEAAKSKHMKIVDKRKFIRSTSICIILIILIIASCVLVINKNKNNTVAASSDIDWPEENTNVNEQSINTGNSIDKTSWNLILVNKDNYLPDNFDVKLKNLSNGHKVDERIYEYLQNMLDDAKKEGLDPIICSSYRTLETQTKLYNKKVKEYTKNGYSKENAEKEASMWVAIPGTSEHHTGLAVDIVSNSYQTLDEKQENTKEQKWLMENSYKYGFILRYPTSKSAITGINYEPWHYRYVGVEHATKIKELGVTLEEYLGK